MFFDRNKTVGALGAMIAAKWYRAANPDCLLIGLDNAETRRWMNLKDDPQRADLLGISCDNGRIFVDVIEVKSGAHDASGVYTIDAEGRLCGSPISQLKNTSRSVNDIVLPSGNSEHILTAPRREVLRSHLFRQALSSQRPRAEKQRWAASLNALFAKEASPEIRRYLIVVSFGSNQPDDRRVLDSDAGRVELVHLYERGINEQLTGTRGSGVQSQQTDNAPTHAPENASQLLSPGQGEQGVATGGIASVAAREALMDSTLVDVSATTAGGPTSGSMEVIRRTCGSIKAACQDFGIRVAEVSPDDVDVGPSVVRYKVRLAPGEDAMRLRRQAENIARQLATTAVPIIDFLPGTHFEYLDLPREDRQVVLLEPCVPRIQGLSADALPILVGVTPSGDAVQLDLGDDRMPHLLVAGGTGSGKTVFLYSVLVSLAKARAADELELVLVDPKRTDFAFFGRLPHLRNGEVITDARQGVEAMKTLVEADMVARTDTLSSAGARDLKAFNALGTGARMRPIVVVIDEYADLVSSLPSRDRQQFDTDVSRLAARGRNVGIHLVLATQRPTAEVVTGNIKANMACRISFSLPSHRDSQVILDARGAERLLRNGDMLLLLEGRLMRLQGYFIASNRIEAVLGGRDP